MAEDVIDYLVEDIMEDLDSENYDPDEFYDQTIEHLSVYGYDLENEVILEAFESDPYDIDRPHLEVLGRFDAGDEFTHLKFVLEDATGDYEVPHVETVDGLDDLTQLSRD